MDTVDPAVDYLRVARSRKSVVKTRFIALVGSSAGRPVLAFEGDDDKIVYGRWISRIKHDLQYEVFVCDGKKGVAELKSILDADLGGLGERVYYFVDRDFIDLTEFDACVDNRIFMTPSYSFENYLVTEKVLDSVLRDEYPLHEDFRTRARVVETFTKAYQDFLYVTGEYNWRLFQARKLSIPLLEKVPRRIGYLADVQLEAVAAGTLTPLQQVQLSRAVSVVEQSLLDGEFRSMNPRMRFRGKNALAFFVKWLSILAKEFADRTTTLFDGATDGSIRHADISLGGLASKSLIPAELFAFVNAI